MSMNRYRNHWTHDDYFTAVVAVATALMCVALWLQGIGVLP